VVQKDVPGFVENRVLYALLRVCVDLVDQGVIDAEGLDTCVSWGIGYKLSVIGPMALLDMAGLDIYQAVGSYLNKELCNRGDLSPYVTERTKAGKLGMKTGSGVFSYTPEKIAELRGLRAKRLVAVRKALES
jgi:3-hydroxybutyryl-CoA dehydrogenase/5-formyl-3-hydroxy-2-methylpyridine 4-carboxylate dehydrogenase